MNSKEFAAKVRAKYPGSYDSLDDATLTQKVIDKYPQYKDVVTMDEGPGAIKSAALGVMSGIPFAETAASGVMSIGDKTYEQSHKELEDLKDKAWENHPVAYGGGKTAGMVGTAFVAPEALGEVGIGNTIGQAAIQGAGYGVDASKNLSDIPIDAIKGGAIGGTIGAVGEKVLSPLVSKLPGMGKAAVSSLGKELTTDDVSAYLQNPEAIRNAMTKPELAENLANTVGDIGKASGHLSEGARSLLNPEVSPLNMGSIRSTIEDASQKYLTNGVPVTAADKTALKTLQDIETQLIEASKTSGGEVPETTLRKMIDRLQSATKESSFGNPEASASQGAMRDLSGKLNSLLRESNPQYASEMAPAAEAAGLSSDLSKKFSLDQGPTDATVGKLNTVMNEGKTESRSLLDQLKDTTGEDFVNKLSNTVTKEHFDAPGTGLGLRTAMGTLGFFGGKATGLPYAGHVGAMAGSAGASAFDGGQIAKKILDMYISGSESGAGQALAKFGPILANAAKQGGNNLASTHFVLATSNPEYQKLVEHSQKDGQ